MNYKVRLPVTKPLSHFSQIHSTFNAYNYISEFFVKCHVKMDADFHTERQNTFLHFGNNCSFKNKKIKLYKIFFILLDDNRKKTPTIINLIWENISIWISGCEIQFTQCLVARRFLKPRGDVLDKIKGYVEASYLPI